MMPNEPMAIDLYAVAYYLEGKTSDCDDYRKRLVAAYLRKHAARKILDMDANQARGGLWGEHDHTD